MKRLLIVVDYQNDFVDGNLGFDKAKKIEPEIKNKIKEYHQKNDEVIFTLDTHDQDYFATIEGKFLPVQHCIKNTKGHELFPSISKEKFPQDKTFEKNTFPSLELANYLSNKDYDSIELCGVVSNICVISNAIMVKAALPNVRIIVDSKAIASNDEKLEQEALDILKNLHIEVL